MLHIDCCQCIASHFFSCEVNFFRLSNVLSYLRCLCEQIITFELRFFGNSLSISTSSGKIFEHYTSLDPTQWELWGILLFLCQQRILELGIYMVRVEHTFNFIMIVRTCLDQLYLYRINHTNYYFEIFIIVHRRCYLMVNKVG